MATGQKCQHITSYPSISAYCSSLWTLSQNEPTICFKLDTRQTILYHSYYEKDSSFTNYRSFSDAEDLFIHTSQGLLLRRRLCAHCCKCEVASLWTILMIVFLKRWIELICYGNSWDTSSFEWCEGASAQNYSNVAIITHYPPRLRCFYKLYLALASNRKSIIFFLDSQDFFLYVRTVSYLYISRCFENSYVFADMRKVRPPERYSIFCKLWVPLLLPCFYVTNGWENGFLWQSATVRKN